MESLNKRQEAILDLFQNNPEPAVSDLLLGLREFWGTVPKITVVRDLNKLIQKNWLQRSGKGRSVRYRLSPFYQLFRPIDVDRYFKINPDQRAAHARFNFDLFPLLHDLFTPEESRRLNELNQKYRERIAKSHSAQLKQEFERLTIEFSWKSSQIEGNTYSLLETEFLIRENREASGHKKEEAIMILNHKKALDYIRKHGKSFKKLSLGDIQDVHRLLIAGLPVTHGFRKSAVGIVGTKYRPLDNSHQIREAMEKAVGAVNRAKNPLEKALLITLLIAYIQPFEDGNKRTGRMIANALLFAHRYCLLSYRSADELEYKKAVLLFYEQNNAGYFKRLFMEQFEFAVSHYFLS